MRNSASHYPGKGLNTVRLANFKNISKRTYLVELIIDGDLI